MAYQLITNIYVLTAQQKLFLFASCNSPICFLQEHHIFPLEVGLDCSVQQLGSSLSVVHLEGLSQALLILQT